MSHAKNQHFTTDSGVDGSAEITGGQGIMFGAYIDGDIEGKTEVEHRLLQEGDGSSSTTITLELGDCKHV